MVVTDNCHTLSTSDWPSQSNRAPIWQVQSGTNLVLKAIGENASIPSNRANHQSGKGMETGMRLQLLLQLQLQLLLQLLVGLCLCTKLLCATPFFNRPFFLSAIVPFSIPLPDWWFAQLDGIDAFLSIAFKTRLVPEP